MSSFPLVDIVLTCYPKNKQRYQLLLNTLNSLDKNTNKNLYRMTVFVDGIGNYTQDFFGANYKIEKNIDHVIWNRNNEGLSNNYDCAIGFIKYLNLHRNEIKERTKYICFIQDDIEFEKNWLEIGIKTFQYYAQNISEIKKIGYNFLACVSFYETPVHKYAEIGRNRFIGREIIWHQYITEVAFMCNREWFCNSKFIPLGDIDRETSQKRGKPNDGRGSGSVWHILRSGPDNILSQKGISIVIPGLVQHKGILEKSTWNNVLG